MYCTNGERERERQKWQNLKVKVFMKDEATVLLEKSREQRAEDRRKGAKIEQEAHVENLSQQRWRRRRSGRAEKREY